MIDYLKSLFSGKRGTQAVPVPVNLIPAIPAIKVQSHSNPEIRYSIKFAEMSCSCPDFIKNRTGFSFIDPRRLCKHLIQATLATPEELRHFGMYIENLNWLSENGKGWPWQTDKYVGDFNGEKAFIFIPFQIDKSLSDESLWVDVYFKMSRFAYNPARGTWTNNSKTLQERQEIQTCIDRAIQKKKG
jgi:hypothetical protein